MIPSWRPAHAVAIAGNLAVQSSPLRVRRITLPAAGPRLDPVAVKLDLMHPARFGWRPLNQVAKLGFDKVRHFRRLVRA